MLFWNGLKKRAKKRKRSLAEPFPNQPTIQLESFDSDIRTVSIKKSHNYFQFNFKSLINRPLNLNETNIFGIKKGYGPKTVSKPTNYSTKTAERPCR
jgi:hypothetical protein